MGGTVPLVHKGSHACGLHHDAAPHQPGVDGTGVDEPAHGADADATELASGLLQVPEQGIGVHESVLRTITGPAGI